jgi:hypothetical protein
VAWGSNGSGQCDVPAPNAGFVAVAGGGYHSLGVKSDGTIVAWGYNGDGQCDVPAPNADFLAVSGGEWYSLGLRSDGSIVAWGANNYGQCDVPAPNTDFFMVAAGSYHSLGLKYDGTIVAWGENGDGQCDIPVPNADFIAVAGGALHSLGLKDASGTGVEEPEPGDVAGGPMLAVLSLSPNPLGTWSVASIMPGGMDVMRAVPMWRQACTSCTCVVVMGSARGRRPFCYGESVRRMVVGSASDGSPIYA